MTDAIQQEARDALWCVVANIKGEHLFGPDCKEVTNGTRQFRGGTKVYIAGCFPGTCDGVVAIGLHRKSRRWITCIVGMRHIENFRVVYLPKVIERIKRDPRCWIRTKEDAEEWAAAFLEWQGF